MELFAQILAEQAQTGDHTGPSLPLQFLCWACLVTATVCFIFVVMKLFAHGQSTAATVAILGYLFVFGLLVALVLGWRNAGAWRVRNLMVVFTASLLGFALLAVYLYYPGVASTHQVG